VIEKAFLTVEAGGAIFDVDGDGRPDVVFGGDWQSGDVWWWRNPGKYDPAISWERRTVKRGGAHQHHDQVFGDFKGTGRPQLVFWNQKAKKLLIAEIPAKPREVEEWPASEVFTEAGSRDELGKYAEGVFAEDVDGDGRVDLLAGNCWFKYLGGGRFKPVKVGTIGGRIVAARLIKGSKVAQVVIAPGDGVGPLKWYECKGDPERAGDWVGHDLLGRDMVHGHSLAVADIDGDGNLDIFAAEMAKWTEEKAEPDNPKAEAVIFFGDGRGGFRKEVFARGMGFHEARVADLNGDGRMDILDKPYNWDAPRVDVWLQEGKK
jgi:hypothetical protein